MVLTRARGVEAFGTLIFALTTQTNLTLVGCLGSAAVVIREGVQRPGDMDAIATSFLILTMTSSIVVCAGSLAMVGLLPMSDGERWLLALVVVGSVPASMNAQPLFDVHHCQARGVAVGALAEIAGLLVVLSLWRTGGLTLPAVGGVYATKWALVSAGQLLVYHTTVRKLRWRYCPADIRRILCSSWPILLAALVVVVPLSTGVLLVRLRSGPADAALFGLAYQVANGYLVFASVGLQVVNPHIAGPFGLHRGFLGKLALFASLLLVGLGVLAFAGGWGVVSLLLSPVYHAALLPMAWLLVAAALLLVARIAHMYLVRFDEGPFVLRTHLVSALLYAGGCLLLPPSWIRTGAAVLAPCAALVSAAACLWRVRMRIREARP
ncbi:MAG: hypothetical protein HY725_05565 [Candidatus Rokubacteria bacterium]|nr:hypothetical protein [Candidatus Rokubacteria bacterium]